MRRSQYFHPELLFFLATMRLVCLGEAILAANLYVCYDIEEEFENLEILGFESVKI